MNPDKHDDRAIALALAAHKLAREVWEQPEPEEEYIEDPRARLHWKLIDQDEEERPVLPGVDYT